MTPHTRSVLGLILVMLVAVGFLIGGAHLLYWQKMGEPTTATVTECVKKRRSDVCKGTWMTKSGFHVGTIENANSTDLGNRVEVRVLGERALIPGLRLPLVLFGVGLGIGILGWVWWVREAPRNRKVLPLKS
jgi:hypothetical protein